MGLNIIMMILGMLVVLGGLIVFVKEQREGQADFALMPLQENTVASETKNELIQLRQEIIHLQNQMDELSLTLQQQPVLAVEETSMATEEKFEQLLNYTRFSQKNNKVIQLYQEGRSPEEIARVLGKSIREVEMVIKLIK